MKAVSFKCPNCQSTLNVTEGATSVECEYCGSTVAIDDGTVKVDVNLSNQEEAGYQFEKGRQRAQAEFQPVTVVVQQEEPAPQKRKTWLWVLGWIFIFPVPLTILMLNSPRTESINKNVRIGIVAAAWIVYLIIAFGGVGSSGSSTNTNANTNTAIEQTTNAGSTSNESGTNAGATKYADDDVVNAFIANYNGTSGSPFTDISKGNIKTKYYAYSYGYYCELLDSNATKKISVTITETNDNADVGVAGMRDVFRDVMKTIDSSLSDDDIYSYFDTMVAGKQSTGTLSNAEISFTPDVDLSSGHSRGHIEVGAK